MKSYDSEEDDSNIDNETEPTNISPTENSILSEKISLFEVLGYFAGGIHVMIFILESILLPNSVKVQKIFCIAKGHMNPSIALFSFNQGCYNLLLACLTFYGLYHGETLLVQASLVMQVGAAMALLISSTKFYPGSIIQGGPPLAALLVSLVLMG